MLRAGDAGYPQHVCVGDSKLTARRAPQGSRRTWTSVSHDKGLSYEHRKQLQRANKLKLSHGGGNYFHLSRLLSE